MYQRRTNQTRTDTMKGGENREQMKLDKDYIIGLTILIAGLICMKYDYHIVGGFSIGLGFILILKSYGK